MSLHEGEALRPSHTDEARGRRAIIVCPRCRYGFPEVAPRDTTYQCPRTECGNRWSAATQTIAAVHSPLRRQAVPELSVQSGADPFHLELPEGESIVGRESSCAFRVNHPSVSRRHARLERRGDRVWIEDLKSVTGTHINGRPIHEPTLLMPTDQVRLAGVVLGFSVRYEASDVGRQLIEVALPLDHQDVAPQIAGVAVEHIPLGRAPVTFGRASDRTVVLPDALISRRHAVLEFHDGAYYLGDVQSQIGTYVNGKSIVRVKLEPGDGIQMGHYLFRFDGRQLSRVARQTALSIMASSLSTSAGKIRLLDEVSLLLRPGEFVGLLGPSGAGKTTLLDALNGLRPAASGHVFINDEDLYGQYERLRHLIGYVPQEDIIHRALTGREALYYAGRLRLPPDTSPAELDQLIEETLSALDLTARGNVPIHRLSGGQRKRVSVGVELLSKPGILFLDEPTSGLDPSAESRLMRKFRELADQGRTVVCTTHVMENVDLFHKVAVLAPGGRLAYFGPPVEAKTYFGIEKFTFLYDKLEERKPEVWQREYRQSALSREQLGDHDDPDASQTRRRGRLSPARASSALRQGLVLSQRFGRVMAADRQNLALLAAQPLIIAGLICLVCREFSLILFLLNIAALWFGTSCAAQQIVQERPVYRRERMVNLRLDCYTLSKFLPLAILATAQSVLMLAMVWLFRGNEGSRLIAVAALSLAASNGVALGLIISALATNTDKAMSVVPLTLLPQIILAGALVPLPDMNEPTRAASCLVVARWANQALEVGLMQNRPINAELLSEPENIRPLWNLYPDDDLRKPDAQLKFVTDHTGTEVNRLTRLWLALGALTSFVFIQLIVVGIVLRWQDSF